MRNIICISGDLGSGKSTVGRIIAEILGYEYYSAGMAFRELAEEKGCSVLDFNNISETDSSIDNMIDSKIAEIGREKENVILDSRMAWHFVNGGFNVYMTVKKEEAARRVMDASRGLTESYSCIEEALESLEKRREAEVKRYKNKYKANICDMDNYHLLVDTTCKSPEGAADFIIEMYKAYRNGK